jgi:hypothetical protein
MRLSAEPKTRTCLVQEREKMVGWEVEGRSEDEVVFLVLIKAAEMDLAARHATFRARRARPGFDIHSFTCSRPNISTKKIRKYIITYYSAFCFKKMASVVRLWLCNTSALQNEMSIVPV